jgi:hypothetical protein
MVVRVVVVVVDFNGAGLVDCVVVVVVAFFLVGCCL